MKQLELKLNDNEYPFNGINHSRLIARAIVFDDDGYFYFTKAQRDDIFGKIETIETSGGGVEDNESIEEAIKRELDEEIGAKVEIITKIGVVNDYYNIVKRHNINYYFLCKAYMFGDVHLTEDEIKRFRISTIKLSIDEAIKEYEKHQDTKLGRLLYNREMPVLLWAKEYLSKI